MGRGISNQLANMYRKLTSTVVLTKVTTPLPALHKLWYGGAKALLRLVLLQVGTSALSLSSRGLFSNYRHSLNVRVRILAISPFLILNPDSVFHISV